LNPNGIAELTIKNPNRDNTSTMPNHSRSFYIHLVYSTKNRQPFLRDLETRADLPLISWRHFPKNFDCRLSLLVVLKIMFHLLCRFGRSITQAEWNQRTETNLKSVVERPGRQVQGFRVAKGYADFSVSQSNLEQVKHYIANQEAIIAK